MNSQEEQSFGMLADARREGGMYKKLKKFAFLFVIFLLSSRAYPQEYKFIGVMGGLAWSWPDEISMGGIPEAHWEETYRLGAVAGCGIGYSSKYLAFEIDALFFQKGCRIANYYWDDFMGYTYYRLNEVSLPLLFKLSPFSGTSPYFLGGFEFAFVLSHKENGPGDHRRDLTQETKKTDSSLILGAGFRQKIEKIYFYVEGRYHYGLRHLNKDGDYYNFPYRQMRSFVLLVGFSI
jgi:hypothetical protein